ncbi:MAG: hypothetical protein ACRC2I_06690, partial [Plesiomonas shigelloides]
MLGLDLGVYGAPETFLIDGQGIIRYRHAGDMNETIWKREVEPLWLKYNGAPVSDLPAKPVAAPVQGGAQ